VPERRNLQATVVAVSAAIATVALAGIFVLYLIDTIGGDDGSSKPGTSGPTSVTPRTPPAGGTTGGTTPPTRGTTPPTGGTTGGRTGGTTAPGGGRLGGGLPGAP
jgi:hypothetical protein